MGVFKFNKAKQATTPEKIQEDIDQNYSSAESALNHIRNNGNSSDSIEVDEDASLGVHTFGGLSNEGARRFVELYDTSPTHQAIVNRTAQMISGAEIDEEINSSELIDNVHSKMLLLHPNKHQTLKDIDDSISLDFKMHGRYAILVGWNSDHDRVVMMKSISVEGVLVGISEDGEDAPFYLHSDDWSDSSIKPTEYAPYDRFEKENEQLLYVQVLRSGHLVYGLPDYYASVKWISIEGGIGVSHEDSVRNGFSPKISITFPAKPESTKIEDDIVKNINKNYAGTLGRRILAVFAPNPSLTPLIQPIDVKNLHDQYLVINDQVQASILTGHGAVSARMFGIKTSSSLSGGNELETAFTMYQNTVVAPYQMNITRTFNRIMRDSGNPNRFRIVPFNLFSSTLTGVDGQSNKTLDALNALNNEVANRIMDKMSDEQIMSLIGLETEKKK